MRSDDIRWLRRHIMATPFGAAFATWLLSSLVGEGQWLFWRDLDPVNSMAGLGTITYGMAVVLAEWSANMVFWALEERKRRARRRELKTLTDVRDRLEEERDNVGIKVVDNMIADLRHQSNGHRDD